MNEPPQPPPTEVASLVGHRNFAMSLRCLRSLARFAKEPLALRIHDDGTLTGDDRERLAALPLARIVSRAEADAAVGAQLARHPASARLRAGNVMALKLFDVHLFSAGRLCYCDSDILFLRPFANLFHARAAGVRALFMADRQNAYSLRSWHTLRYPQLRLPWRANSGLLEFLGDLDLDLVEWYLSRPGLEVTPVWLEQTAWGLLGFRAGCNIWDGGQIMIPTAAGFPAGAVALHYTSSSRHLFPAPEDEPPASGAAPVELRSRPARRCRLADLAVGEGVRRSRRMLAAAAAALRPRPAA